MTGAIAYDRRKPPNLRGRKAWPAGRGLPEHGALSEWPLQAARRQVARGVASPRFAAGGRSKYLPARLLERYDEAERDEQLLELRGDVALLEARLAELLGRIDTGESGASWKAARGLVRAYRKARAELNDGEADAAVMALEAVIERGLGDYAVWDEIRDVLDRRRKLIESERRRLVEMQQVITYAQAMTFLATVSEAIRRHVTDPAVLAALSAELGRLAAVGPRQLAGPGGNGRA